MKYMVRYVHKIAPRASDVMGPVEINDNAFSNRNTLAAALRKAKVLSSGDRLRSFRVEDPKIVAFPMASIWHAVIIEPA